MGYDLLNDESIKKQLILIKEKLKQELYVADLIKKAESIAGEVVTYEDFKYDKRNRQIDKIVTSKFFSLPIMLCLLMLIFWITIKGANYPSDLLFNMFNHIEQYLLRFLAYLSAPNWLIGVLISGIYRVLTWVIAVMLPPMADLFSFDLRY